MHLIEPTGRKRKWDIRLRNHDGRIVKIPGDVDPSTATRIGERVERLMKAKQNGDPPPGDLATWIANMEHSLAKRLIHLALIPAVHRARHTPLTEWVEPWGKVVQGRNTRPERHAREQMHKVQRTIEALEAIRLEDLDADSVRETINAFRTEKFRKPTPLATATRRSYMVAIKDFAKWLSRKLKVENPLADLDVPGQYEDPQYERQPLTVEQFQKLMRYLDTFEYYPGQKARWSAHDRKLIYWTAVKTGYRQTELKKLRRWNLCLDEQPAVICLKARDTKNKTKGEVPIPDDLALALSQYVAHLDPEDVVFPFPSTCGSIVDMLRRDLDGAGIPWKLPSGEIIDFHSLRSTAITWWLVVDRLVAKEVQVMARLKSPQVVARYSRNYRMNDFSWLNRGPTLVTSSTGLAAS